MKPKVVIYSALENEAIAKAIQANIMDCADVVVWTQGVFEPSTIPVEVLTHHHDFAILILASVDRLVTREHEYLVPRDNVVFEAGLFLGRLGRERTFLVSPLADQLKDQLPRRKLANLEGITQVRYDPSQSNLQAAVARACTQITAKIKRLGVLGQKVHIINKKSGRCLDVEGGSDHDGTPIIQFKFHGSENQLWKLLRIDKGRFKVMSVNSEKFLDIVGQSTNAGAYANQWAAHDGASQDWQIEPLPDGAFKIMCVKSEKYLAVESGSNDDKARIVQESWRNDDSFRWWVNATPELA